MTDKEQMIKTIEAQPSDSSYDEILKELVLKKRILAGLKDSMAGKGISHQSLGEKIQSW